MSKTLTGKLNCINCQGTSDWIQPDSDHIPDSTTHATFKISDSNENICYVKCPHCRVDLVQCRLCTYNFIKNDNPVLIKSRRSPEGYMTKHLKQKHNIATHKRQKTSGSCKVTGDIPDMTTDCIFDCETIQQPCKTNLLNESEGEDDCEEDEEANEYVNQFMGTDLDPTTTGDEGEMYDDLTQRDQDQFIHNINEIGYSYNDFIFFDKRTEEEKLFRKGG